MSRSAYAQLNQEFGHPLSSEEIAAATERQHDALFAQHLVPESLSAEALGAVENVADLKVAVVGGGFAGLMTAWYLHQCGASPTVFEANNRLGGRVRSDLDLIPGKVVEAGAELIGTNHAMWRYLAGEFSLDLVELTTDEDYEAANLAVRLRIGDLVVSGDERRQVFTDLEPMLDAIGSEAFDIDQVSPWLSPNAAAFDAISVETRLNQLFPTSSTARSALDLMLGNDNCAPPASQSYLGLLALVSAGRMGDDAKGMRGFWDYTETHRCGGGNEQLADQLAAPLNDVRLDTPLTNVRFEFLTETGDLFKIVVSWGGEEPGEDDTFAAVVFACPPKSFPQVDVFGFDPALFTMADGPAVKYLSVVPTRFWEDEGLAPLSLWDALGSTWEGTDRQQDPGPYCLSVFSGGTLVLPESQYRPLLEEWYPGYTPTDAFLVDWPNTPFIQTGYSVPALGQVTTIAPALSVGFLNVLRFAGEQSYVPFFGYMEGALRSGARAARDIIAAVAPNALNP